MGHGLGLTGDIKFLFDRVAACLEPERRRDAGETLSSVDPEEQRFSELRQQAEAILRGRLAQAPSQQATVPVENALRAFHELSVHQIELEMQNEELHRMADLVEARTLEAIILDSCPDRIWSVDPQRFALLTFNQALRAHCLAKHGLHLELGMLPEACWPGASAERWRGLYRMALAEGPFALDSPGTGDAHLSFSLLRHEGTLLAIAVFAR
jgi:hypothetical protein